MASGARKPPQPQDRPLGQTRRRTSLWRVPPTVVVLRRYPVKAMGGEHVDTVDVEERGIAGDRWYAVTDDDGRLATGKDSTRFRRHDEVFDFAARTVEGRVRIRRQDDRAREWDVDDPAAAAHLSAVMGTSMTVRPETGVGHQDGAPVSLIGTATLRWCAERFGDEPDARRLRTNIVLETDEPFVEESWVGRTLEIGTAALTATERVERCRMIDLAQDGVSPQGRWLAGLGRDRDVRVAVYATVARPGRIAIGDVVTVGP